MTSGRVSNIILFILIIISLVIMGMFYFGGYVDVEKEHPIHMGLALNWTKVLLGIAILVTILFFVYKLVTDTKNSLKSLLGLALLLVVFFIAWSMGSGEQLVFKGYTGPDNVPSKLKLADMMLYTAFILLIATVVAIVVGEIIKKVRT